MAPTGFRDSIARFRDDLDGNIVILFALMCPLILMVVGISVDLSRAITVKTQVQAALDSAVLAGAKVALTQDKSQSLRVANQFFHANADPIVPESKTDFRFDSSGKLTGSVSYELTTFFGAVTGAAHMGQSLTSSAGTGANKATTANVCMLLLSNAKEGALQIGAGASVHAPRCEIDVASRAQFGALFDAGSSLTTSRLCLQGADYFQNGGNEPNISINCPPAVDPFARRLPRPPSTNCSGPTAHGGSYSGEIALSPGVYCGIFTFAPGAKVTFKPGLYIVRDGGWNVAGGAWRGAGVTFYFADTSRFSFGGPMDLSLSAPASGPDAGILLYEAEGLSTTSLAFDNRGGEALSGLIYLPSRDLSFISPAATTSPDITLVADSLTLGEVHWNLSPDGRWPIVNNAVGTPVEPDPLSQASDRPSLTR